MKMNVSYRSLVILFAIQYTLLAGAATPQVIENEMNACWNKNVEIQGNVSMNPTCIAKGGVLIRTSGTHLDCRGGTISLDKKVNSAIIIDSQGEEIQDISIKNCILKGSKFKTIYIGWNQSDRKKSERLSREELYERTPKNITIEKTRILESGSSGIYIDDYTQNVTMNELIIENTPAMAIYFEFSSKGNILKNSTIRGAGKAVKREAISIDSSQSNLIENNKFIDNPYGGIFIYKNCSEHLKTRSNQVTRWMSADHNQIMGNEIVGSRRAVWIAARQSKRQHKSECGNGYYAEDTYTLDSAKNNLVAGNKISKAEVGIIVEDDFNEIRDNQFEDISREPIWIGTPMRSKYLNQPVQEVKVTGNKLQGRDAATLYRWGSKKSD